MTVPLDTKEIEQYRACVGRTAEMEQRLDAASLRRFAAVLGIEPEGALALTPPLGHWAFFLQAVVPGRLGPDGHPLRGDFLPAIRLPRRMFAGGKLDFLAPLEADEPASLVLTIADVKHRSGKGGDLILVDMDRVLTQAGTVLIRERQTIAYVNIGGRIPPVVPAEAVQAADIVASQSWSPDEVDLFRFSAVTFNGHRIHYDRRYTSEVELYPDLVVHGPFTAAKLCGLAGEVLGRPVRHFEFKAVAPIFVGQPIRLRARREGEGLSLEAVRCDGTVAMTARSDG